jgi:16S rRNA C967 or C1407 C5-methylase (RsmB/RsmF family)
MTKKRKEQTTNPLSNARNANGLFESLWHKKTGKGYLLFVEYYGQQGWGVVVQDQQHGFRPLAKTPPAAVTQSSSTQGMSRAAKRRRKKKGVIGSEGHSDTKVPKTITGEQTSASEPTSSSVTSGPLQEALDSHAHEYSFLQPLVATLSKPLPVSFRLRSLQHYPEADKYRNEQLLLVNRLVQDFGHLVQPVPYHDTIYQTLNLDKSSLNTEAPELKELLLEASSRGILARQEVGSMLPVLGLETIILEQYREKKCRILDLCASPGSKTLQALELLNNKSVVVANDVHPKRLEALHDALQRSGVPTTDRVILKQHDASVYPMPKQQPHIVIADVPCSGDGTIRKDPSILKTWDPVTARTLHALQCRILHRALQLVRVGGVVSYSTCSLNPIENEAVVQAALSKYGAAVQLEDWPNAMKGLILRPGVSTWKVFDYCMTEEDEIEWKDYWSELEAKKGTMRECHPTLWPDTSCSHVLHRCRRLWPQDQNSGGFFVALLRKTAELEQKAVIDSVSVK